MLSYSSSSPCDATAWVSNLVVLDERQSCWNASEKCFKGYDCDERLSIWEFRRSGDKESNVERRLETTRSWSGLSVLRHLPINNLITSTHPCYWPSLSSWLPLVRLSLSSSMILWIHSASCHRMEKIYQSKLDRLDGLVIVTLPDDSCPILLPWSNYLNRRSFGSKTNNKYEVLRCPRLPLCSCPSPVFLWCARPRCYDSGWSKCDGPNHCSRWHRKLHIMLHVAELFIYQPILECWSRASGSQPCNRHCQLSIVLLSSTVCRPGWYSFHREISVPGRDWQLTQDIRELHLCCSPWLVRLGFLPSTANFFSHTTSKFRFISFSNRV